jgi:ketosteroid isomerase-like protein
VFTPQEHPLTKLTGDFHRTAFLVIVMALAIACSPRTPDEEASGTSASTAAVDSASNRLLSALRSDSRDSLLALMTEDVVLMPPNEPVLRGKAAVSEWYGKFVGMMRTTGLTVTNREVLMGGDYASEIATFEWGLVSREGGPAITDRGSYIQVWQRQPDGRWLFSREVWNSMAPPGG